MTALTEWDLFHLTKFKEKYPTWWWKIGWCDVSGDFDCAPQAHSPEAKYIKINNVWDNGFSCDASSIGNAIVIVMVEIEKEIERETDPR